MTTYRPILSADPSEETLLQMFNASEPADWLHDPETNSFALKKDTVVRVLPNESGGFSLLYGYDEVAPLSERQICSHLEPGPR